ncbi:MAG: sugar phosphate isomerase/epimerase [Abditibacteriota bacterium]|nr:sugar phosphate isomerase/epimerase [Abditibacteriota bacterium]
MERKYSVILGNLGNTKDRFCGAYKENPSTEEMLEKASKIPYVKGIELVGTWDISEDTADKMNKAFKDLGMTCVSIIPDLFANPLYGKGSYTSKDPAIRRDAIDYTKRMCEAARIMGCKTINIWPGQDGYDYQLTADYEWERNWELEAVVELAEAYPDIDFALEYKPKEPRTHSYMARMGDTLVLAMLANKKNVGVTIDTGHGFEGGEVIGESIVLAKSAGDKLFHMHFNDNFASWDDDMMVGSVHSIEYIEILYWLDRTGYTNWLSMDQYPYREDAAGAIGESIQWLVKFDEMMTANRDKITELIRLGNPIETSKFLRSVL